VKGVFLPSFLATLLLAGCGSQDALEEGDPEPGVEVPDPSGAFPFQLVDASGDTLYFSSPPRRIIPLVPSASHVLMALGAGARLAGRTDFDTVQSMRHLPSVGGGLSPNLEAILALDPDLVIRFAGETDPTTAQRLDRLGIPHLAIRPDGLQEIRKVIRQLGMVTGRRAAADSLLAVMAADLQALEEWVQEKPGIRAAYVLGGNPPWVAGPGSYLHELMELAGGINVFSDLEGLYGPVNAEAFLSREIDLILAPPGAELDLPHPAPPVRRVPSDLEIPGPDLARHAWALARAMHPHRVP